MIMCLDFNFVSAPQGMVRRGFFAPQWQHDDPVKPTFVVEEYTTIGLSRV